MSPELSADNCRRDGVLVLSICRGHLALVVGLGALGVRGPLGAPGLDVGIIRVLRQLHVLIILVVGVGEAALELVVGGGHVGRILVVGRLLGVVERLLVGLGGEKGISPISAISSHFVSIMGLIPFSSLFFPFRPPKSVPGEKNRQTTNLPLQES